MKEKKQSLECGGLEFCAGGMSRDGGFCVDRGARFGGRRNLGCGGNNARGGERGVGVLEEGRKSCSLMRSSETNSFLVTRVLDSLARDKISCIAREDPVGVEFRGEGTTLHVLTGEE